MKKFSRSLKMVGVITLFFFAWSYLPLFQLVAYAATQDKQATKAQPQRSGKQQPAEKLEKLLDDLKADTSKAEGKAAKGEDTSSEVEAIKSRKAEIDAIDTELKKEYASTEQRLKSANLSKEILDRHYTFVKNYENSLAELKANIDSIDKAKTPSALTSELAKTQKHLSKIKPPKKRKVLDPNKLPNGARPVKHAAVEEKKPEVQKTSPVPLLRKKSELHRPILVASNGSLDGLVSSPQPVQLADITTDSVMMNSIIAVTPPPSDADLVETPEVRFSQAIKDLAAQLKNQPVNLYEYVRNNIEFAPTYGSISGADACLQAKICNDMDTASLLIALFRASNYPARYAYGTIEVPIEKVMNWVGGVTDPNTAATILATNGIPGKIIISGGVIKAIQLDHTWVEAYVPYGPFSGRLSKLDVPKIWVPLDPSYKQYNYTQGIDVTAAVPFDAQTFANQILSTATTNTIDGSVTNVNSALVQQTMQDYQTRVQNYIQQNYPNATVGDVIGKKEIKKQEFGILPVTLPYKAIQPVSTFSQVPDNLRETISFTIPDPSGTTNGLSYTTSLPQIAGKKITLSFAPSTANDETVIESFLPKPHADGTPTQLTELPSSFPAYLINLTPTLRVDGQIVATGTPITMGSALSFTMSLNEPGIGLSNIDNVIQAGEYYGIGLDTGRMADLNALKTKLEATKAKIDTQNFTGLTNDDVVGDLLYTTIATYFSDLDISDEITAQTQGVIRYRAPSVGMCSTRLAVRDVFGIPTSAGIEGLMMDVDRLMQAVFGKDGSMDKVKKYMLASGSMSSALEHVVPTQMYSTQGNTVQAISAVKALQIANDQGIPIYTINQSNVSAILPQLQLSQDVKNDILNAANAGKEVTVSRANINYNGWLGCGYIILDPITGAGAYMISSGTNGALFIIGVALLLLALSILAGPIVFALVSLLLPIYIAFMTWLMTQASSTARACVVAIAFNILVAMTIRTLLFPFISSQTMRTIINSIRVYFGSQETRETCWDGGTAY